MSHPYKEKILRDPVYGDITISSPLLLDLLNTMEFQRLRRIRQLGMCFWVFHGAEHSRFQHSLGVMWLMHRILSRWRQLRYAKLDKHLIEAACAAALLHDIGHGPFSHALERVFAVVDHEHLGQAIVRQRLAPIFARHDVDAELVIAIMNGTFSQPLYHELLSSQLDVDRMDYLQRDSLYTGAKYGIFDIERIIATLLPMPAADSQELVCAIAPKGCEAVEGYIFSRYYMHWQVYLHRTVRASETLLRVILERTRYLYQQDSHSVAMPSNLHFLFASHSSGTTDTAEIAPEFLEDYLNTDDSDFYHAVKLWAKSDDTILSDLATRFMHRQPFKAFIHPGDGAQLERIEKLIVQEYGENSTWYMHSDTAQNRGYDIYTPGSLKTPIRVLVTPPNIWKEISEASRTKSIVALSEPIRRPLLMVPHECWKRIKRWLDTDKPYQALLEYND